MWHTHTHTHTGIHTYTGKPFGLRPLSHRVASGQRNQQRQSVGQVRSINCSKSRRVFVSSSCLSCRVSLCLSLCLCVCLCFCYCSCFHHLTDMRQIIWPLFASMPAPAPPSSPLREIDSSQCKLLPFVCRVTSSVCRAPLLPTCHDCLTIKSTQSLWHNLYRAASHYLATARLCGLGYISRSRSSPRKTRILSPRKFPQK